MSAPPLVCAAVEVALNRFLNLEPDARDECARLQGRVIALQAQTPPWTLFVEFIPAGVRVLSQWDAAPDVSVRGDASTLLRLAWQVGQGQSGVPQGLQVEGDTELLHRFNRVLASVGFDPEELAARVVGDAAAHRLVQGLKSVFGWGRRSAETLGLDAAEYLREETGDLARAADVREWMDAVDLVRDGVERFDARLARLEIRRGSAA